MNTQTPQNRVLFASTLRHPVFRVFAIVLTLVTVVVASPVKPQGLLQQLLPSQPVATAATSSTINFQARLQNAAGAIAPDGSYNVEFNLYSVSSGGSSLWTEDYLNSATNGVTVKNGYLTVNLGSTTAFPSTINWDQDLFLGMTVRGTGSCTFGSCTPADGEMTPRLKLTASAYAFKAGQLAQYDSSSTFTSSLKFSGTTTGGNQIFQIQDAGAAGTYTLLTSANGIQLQGSTPGTAQTGNFNISGTGIAGVLQSTSLSVTSGALNLTATSGALSLSGLSASSISTGTYALTVTSSNFNTTATGINSTAIGATTASTGAFTTLSAVQDTTLGSNVIFSSGSNHSISVATATNANGNNLTISGGSGNISNLATIVGQTTTFVNGGSSTTASYPAGMQVGDIMIMHVGHYYPTSSTPAGWTLMNSGTGGNTNGELYQKTVVSGDIGSSIAVNFSGGGNGNVVIVAVRNVTAVHDFKTSWSSNGPAVQSVGPLTTTGGDIVLSLGYARLSGATISLSQGSVTSNINNSGAVGVIGSYTASASGTPSQTFTASTTPNSGFYYAYLSFTPTSPGATGGNLTLTGGGGAGAGAGGAVIVKAISDSTAAFQVQNASGVSLLSADTSNMAIGIAGNATITGTTTGDAFTVSNSTGTGNVATFKDNTTTVASIADGGAFRLQNSVDSTAAFNILNNAGTSILKVDTAGQLVTIDTTNSFAPLSVGKTGSSTYNYGFESGITSDYTTSGFTLNSGVNAHSGSYYMNTGNGDLYLTKTTTAAGTVSFYAWCTGGAGYMDFYIDGVWQGHVCGSTSGYSLYSYPVSAGGTHVFDWNVYSCGSYVDDVSVTNVASNGVSANFEGYVGISMVGTPAYDLTFGAGANRIIGLQAQPTSNLAGNNLTLQSAAGNGTGNGGGLTLQGGASGAGATGNGGVLTLVGGAASSTNGNGGNIVINGGTKTGTGTVGQVLITSSNFNTTATGINGTAIGATTASSGAFTTLSATGAISFQNSSDSATALTVKDAAGTSTILQINTTGGYVGIDNVSPQAPLDVGLGKAGTFTDGFESGSISPFVGSGNMPWSTITSTANSGTFSAVSGSIGNSQTSTMSLTNTLSAGGTISFAYSTSTESSDRMYFYIDGVQKAVWGTSVTPWTPASFPLTSGTHTYTWSYIKDSSGSLNADKVYIDDVQITNVTASTTSALFAGNVGIGGGSPAYALDVTGTIRASSSLLGPSLDTATAASLGIGTTTANAVSISKSGVTTTVNGALAVTQATTLSGNLTVTNAGSVAFQQGADFTTTGQSNNVNFGTGVLFRLTGASAQTITGIAGGTNGRTITLVNAGASTAVIADAAGALGANSLAANRISTGTAANINLASGASINLVYDSTASLWRVIGSAGGSTGGTYITLQGSTPGTADTGNLNISGTAIFGTAIQGPSLDTASAGTLGLGTGTNSSAVSISKSGATTTVNGALTVTQATTFNGNVTLGATKTLTLTGDITGNRPASPTEGTLYYDTTTKQLLIYANGKWQANRESNTKIVAASNSTPAEKDAADYVATGSGDQSQINSALIAASGGQVYLIEGTYNLTAAISVPNNTTLSGAGAGTVITLPNSQNGTYNMITNTTSPGTNISIHDLKIDGNVTNQTSGTMNGIYLNSVGSGTGTSAVDGATLYNLSVINLKGGAGIQLNASSNNVIRDSFIQGISYGIYLSAASGYNTIANNSVEGVVAAIDLNASNNNQVSGNTALGAGTYGQSIFLVGASSNMISSNTTTGGNNGGIVVTSSSNTNVINNNRISDAGGTLYNWGIFFDASDSNTVTGNSITDTAHSSSNDAIWVTSSTSDTNYLSNNTLGGGSINDTGTGTIFAGQQNASGYFVFNSASARLGLGNVSPAYALDVTGQINSTTGFLFNGTAGTTTTCNGATPALSNVTIQGGIITGVTCAAAGGGGGSYVTLQGSTPGTADTGNLNISGTGIFATALQAPSLDTASAGTLGLGTGTNSSAVSISKSGATTTVNGVLNVLQAATFNGSGFDVTGNLGIGTTSPGRPLQVSTNNSTVNAQQLLIKQNGSGDAGLELQNGSSSYYVGVDSSNASRFTINSSVAASAGTTTNSGFTSPSGSFDFGNNGSLTVSKVTAGATGTVSTISVYIHAVDASNPHMQVALYADDTTTTGCTVNSCPGGVAIAHTGSQTLTANSWNSFSISASVTNGTSYWIAFNVDGAATQYNTNGPGRASFMAAVTYGDWSRTYSQTGSGATPYTVYMTINSGTNTDNNANPIFSLGGTGDLQLRNVTDSTSAFSIQNAAGTNLLTADTSNKLITINGGLTVTNAGNVAFQKGTNYSTTGSQNNVNFGTGALFRLTGASAQTITGIAGGVDGRIITLVNAGANGAILKNNSGLSSSGNQIVTGTGSDFTIPAGGSISLVYDAGTSPNVWRVVAASAGGGGGVSALNTQVGALTLQGTANQIVVTNGSGTITLSTPQDINTTSGVTFGSLTVGASGNTVVLTNNFSTSGRIYNGTARPTRTIKLTPEFPSAVFSAISGSGANVGYMNSDYDSTSHHNYYRWTTDQATAQDYDIIVQYQLPSDFDAMVASSVKSQYFVTNTSINSVKFQMLDASGTSCGAMATISTTAGAWSQSSGMTPSGCTLNADDVITLDFRMSATTAMTNLTQLGTFQLQYYSKF